MIDRSPLERLFQVMAQLRAPGGCPWDRAQTHASLLPYLLEETCETIEAVEAGDLAGLAEELGDLLVEVAMQIAIAAEEGAFDLEAVATRATEKMISRHPHVFMGASVEGQEELLRNWESLKRAEKPQRTSVLDGLPRALPALALATSAQRRTQRTTIPGSPELPGEAAIAQLLGRVGAWSGPDSGEAQRIIGELLFAVVTVARRLEVDPEAALRGVVRDWTRAFQEGERKSSGEPDESS